MLAVVAVFFNSNGYSRPRQNFLAWCDYMRKHQEHVFVLEGYRGQRPQPILPNHQLIEFKPENLMWQKEKMFQLVIDSLPARFDQVAIVDADIIYCRPDWYTATVDALRIYDAVQMCDFLHQTDKNYRLTTKGKMLGAAVVQGLDLKANWFHTGGCWAGERDLIYRSQFVWDVIGGGDSSMAMAMTNQVERSARDKAYSKPLYNFYLEWASKLRDVKVGYVEGDAYHLWHGEKVNRQYVPRHQILKRFNFDPIKNLKESSNGLWEFHNTSPMLQKAVAKYFIRRKEDG